MKKIKKNKEQVKVFANLISCIVYYPQQRLGRMQNAVQGFFLSLTFDFRLSWLKIKDLKKMDSLKGGFFVLINYQTICFWI